MASLGDRGLCLGAGAAGQAAPTELGWKHGDPCCGVGWQ